VAWMIIGIWYLIITYAIPDTFLNSDVDKTDDTKRVPKPMKAFGWSFLPYYLCMLCLLCIGMQLTCKAVDSSSEQVVAVINSPEISAEMKKIGITPEMVVMMSKNLVTKS
jgi:Na+/proline symporter